MGYWSVVSIGIGGMVGGGIFAVLGLSVQLARGATPIAFAIAGGVAIVTAYSYAKLTVAYPSPGGTVEFLNQAMGAGLLSGSLNVLLYLSYIAMLSLYAYAFGSYAATFFPVAAQAFWRHLLMSAVIIVFTVLNTLGSRVVGEAEEWVVGFKMTILGIFVVLGFWSVDLHRLAPATWAKPLPLLAGGMVIFLAYEGFELIANTAMDVKERRHTLPKAYYSSVGIVILLYILVSLVTVGNLPLAKILAARDYALAEAARPFLGSAGFSLIAVAALLSTGSAINATIYGASRISYIIAKEGELPALLERKIWNQPMEGLFITTVLTLLVANFFDLTSISTMGSAGFLLIFAAVNGANVRLRKQTLSRAWLSRLGVVVCLGALLALGWQTASTNPGDLWVLLVMVGLAVAIEAAYRGLTGRVLRPFHRPTDSSSHE